MDNGVNTLQSLREVPINEIVDDDYLYTISVLGVRGFHSISFS